VIVLNTKAKVPDGLIKYLISLQLSHKIQFMSVEKFMEKYLCKIYIPEDHRDIDFLSDIQPYNPLNYFLKRTIDYTGAFILYFLAWPILIYSRRRIKRESPGTSMFKQLRVGQNNIEFFCIKFRSMDLNAEVNGAQFASQNDPRVFPWGNFMRKTRIDELPQLINIVRGEMHLIGPRPERKFWADQFEQEIPYYSERHIVKPGITGWAQVMYPYGANVQDAKQKLMYDLYYIKNWSILLEFKIIWKTILVVVGKKGM
jgi:lipopolysaccharide/colanic/teichoic acid biosynthesis glycosyltransferase